MFYIGQQVVCVDDTEQQFPWYCCFNEIKPVKGNIYTIRGFEPEPYEDFPGLYLEEIINKPGRYAHPNRFYGQIIEQSFHIGRFKPIQKKKTDISIFTKMLNKQPELV